MSDKVTKMTTAEFRAQGGLDKILQPAKARTTRKSEPRDGATTHCVTHDESFTTDTTENRHVDANHGCRLEWLPC